MDQGNEGDALSSTPTVSIGLDIRAAGNESLVYDPASGKVHVLNAMAAQILGRCDGSTSLTTIVDDVVEATGEDRERVTTDVVRICAEFRDNGLIS